MKTNKIHGRKKEDERRDFFSAALRDNHAQRAEVACLWDGKTYQGGCNGE